jgi:hypothetical protein
MGLPEIEAFLTHLAIALNVTANTQNQALNAILFLYRQVLKQELDSRVHAIRAKRPSGSPLSSPPKKLVPSSKTPPESIACSSNDSTVADFASTNVISPSTDYDRPSSSDPIAQGTIPSIGSWRPIDSERSSPSLLTDRVHQLDDNPVER